MSGMRLGGWRDRTLGRRGVLTAIAVIAAVALLWALGRSVDRSHTAASDSQLAADLQIARGTLGGDIAAAARRASALARLPSTQAALASGNRGELAAVVAVHPGALLIAAGGARAGSLAPLGVRRVAVVVVGSRTIGRVFTEAPLDSSYLKRVRAGLPAGTNDLVVVTNGGRVAAGSVPAGTALSVGSGGNVRVDGHGYRALSSPLSSDQPEIRIVALARRSGTFLSSWRLPLAVLATLAALALVMTWMPRLFRARQTGVEPDLRTHVELLERPSREPGMPGGVALLGETLAATHDPEALLAVVLDAAIEATGAVDGRLLRGNGTGSRAGYPGNGSLTVTLDTNEAGGSSLVLFPPAKGFTAEAEAVAQWLGIQAGTAIKNARLHTVAEQHALTDELTGLANRRHFMSTLTAELARAERFGAPLAVLLTDLDDFKRINDRFGHPAGDEVLRSFARALQRSVRKIDLAARIGGDEFAVVLPQTGAEGARRVAERLRGELRGEQGLSEGITASFGVASYPQAASAEELLVDADAFLYQAKAEGRDKVVLRGGDPPAAPRR